MNWVILVGGGWMSQYRPYTTATPKLVVDDHLVSYCKLHFSLAIGELAGADIGVPKVGVLDCKCACMREIFDHAPKQLEL